MLFFSRWMTFHKILSLWINFCDTNYFTVSFLVLKHVVGINWTIYPRCNFFHLPSLKKIHRKKAIFSRKIWEFFFLHKKSKNSTFFKFDFFVFLWSLTMLWVFLNRKFASQRSSFTISAAFDFFQNFRFFLSMTKINKFVRGFFHSDWRFCKLRSYCFEACILCTIRDISSSPPKNIEL